MKHSLSAVALGSVLALAASAQPPQMRAGVSVRMVPTKNATALPQADQPEAVVVAVTRDGQTYLEVTRVSPAELAARLPAGRPVFVKADARSPFPVVARVLAALRQAGVSAPWLLTDQKDTPEPQSPIPPKGLQIRLTPPSAALVEVSLQAAPQATFADVVKVLDACRGAGAEVLLPPSGSPTK